MTDQPLAVRLAESFGSRPISRPRLDELELQLLDTFGESAAEIDYRAQQLSGVDPVLAVQSVIDGRRA